jgi:hypothetical protein
MADKPTAPEDRPEDAVAKAMERIFGIAPEETMRHRAAVIGQMLVDEEHTVNRLIWQRRRER